MTTNNKFKIVAIKYHGIKQIRWIASIACVAMICSIGISSIHAQVATVQTVPKGKQAKSAPPRKEAAELLNIALQQPMLAERTTKHS